MRAALRRSLPVLVAVLVALVADLGAAGCSSLPRGGPVKSLDVTDNSDRGALFDYTPPGPRAGSDRGPLVEDFLTSMTAIPLNTYVAREYLTSTSSRTWMPEQGTVVYGSHQLVTRPNGRVMLRLRDVVQLDGRGSWKGDPTGGHGHDYLLRMVKQDGQWRISHPPDRLLIPRSNFESQYQQHELYFLDTTGQVLVPEPVYVARGRQTPTLLVAGLLKGPEPSLRDTDRTSFPDDTSLDGISVPVTDKGTAEVPLSDAVLDADDDQLRRLFAQLAWTLSQVNGVDRIRVTVGGTPVELPKVSEDVGVDGFTEFDPSLGWASTALFGLRRGRVVTVDGGPEQRVTGPFGTLRLGVRSIGVDMLAQHVAAVTTNGRAVLEGDQDGVPGHVATRKDVRTVYRGATDLLPPVFDLHGLVWLADRTSSGARLVVVRSGRPQSVHAPGVTGADVRQVTVSRDGTRLVTVVRRGGHDVLLVSRVRRDDHGRVRSVGSPRRLPVTGPGPVRGVTWRTPDTLAVLVSSAGSSAQVELVSVDGSQGLADVTGDPEPFGHRATTLASSPAPSTPLLVGTPSGQLYSLSSDRGWVATPVSPGLRSPTFVG